MLPGTQVTKAQAKQLQRQQMLTDLTHQDQILLQKRLHSMRQDGGKGGAAQFEMNGESSKIKINYANHGGKAQKTGSDKHRAWPKAAITSLHVQQAQRDFATNAPA